MSKHDVFARIKEIGLIPAIRPADPQEAVHAAAAIRLGGVPIIEICMAMPGAPDSIAEVRKACGTEILIGAGTVIDPAGVGDGRLSGADFIVTSGFSQSVVDEAHRLGVPVLVGALTPTEVQWAINSRADAVKLFPCNAVGGPRYLTSLRAQYPSSEMIASGGVTLDNCSDYLRAGACAVGVGSEIGDAQSMASGDHRLFTERARRFRKVVCESRKLFQSARPR